MSVPYSPATAGHPQTRERSRRLGEVVRAERKARGWSQEALAEKLGWHRESINRVEKAKYAISLHRLWLLADALGLPAAALVAAAEQPQPGGWLS